jgi:hypothetical protein
MKSMRRALAGLLAIVVAACGSMPPGEDDRGAKYKEPATKVLLALEAYKTEQGRYPNSLYALVPRYLDRIPAEPTLRLDEYTSTLRFAYSLEWPELGRVVCVATLSTTEWKCEEYQ